MSRGFTAGSVVVCSVYPLQLGPERRPYGEVRGEGSTIFKIPAVSKDSDPPYRLLEVRDSWQRERDWMQHPGTASEWKYELIFAEDIASDLITNWTTGLLNADEGGHPGVGKIAGPKPTSDELAALWSAQTRFFEALYYQGQKMAQENNWKQITSLNRQAAQWLGKDVKDAAWVKPFDPAALKTCPLCQSRIPQLAVFCPQCHQQIAAIPKDLDFKANASVVSNQSNKPQQATSR